jgi:hypothetical protein
MRRLGLTIVSVAALKEKGVVAMIPRMRHSRSRRIVWTLLPPSHVITFHRLDPCICHCKIKKFGSSCNAVDS